MSPEKSDKGIENDRRTGEQVPLWLAAAEERMNQEIEAIRRAEQKRLVQGRATAGQATQAARESAERIKGQKQTRALENRTRYSFVFEIFTACGFQGRSADAKNAFVPGYLGRLTEISLVSQEDDVHKGIDFIVRIPTAKGEVRIGVDVTYSPLKLEHKFEGERGIRATIDSGQATKLIGSGEEVLRVVVGVSRVPMETAVREWGREKDRKEAYAITAIGECIRGQVIAQLTVYEAYARAKGTPAHTVLADKYKEALEALTNEKFIKLPKPDLSLAKDEVNLQIHKQTEKLKLGA